MRLMALGIDPYGGRFDGSQTIVGVRRAVENLHIGVGERSDRTARVAGRIVLLRDMGKLAFLTIHDDRGRLQIGLNKGDLGDSQWAIVKQLDLGDFIGVDGVLGRTKTGELTLWCNRLTFLTKALQPPPEKWHGLTDVDLRYRRQLRRPLRQPGSPRCVSHAPLIIHAVRTYLTSHAYYEVETPVLQPMYGGAAARPFTTHHNTLDMRLFLRISPELYLKRLLVGGMERVFEISRNFRNEGISTKHNPEFTMVELYEAYADYRVMMERVEGMAAAAFEAATRQAVPRARRRSRRNVNGSPRSKATRRRSPTPSGIIKAPTAKRRRASPADD